jgi:hypothetical protein
MSAQILDITFPAATNKRALRLLGESRSRPHGITGWTTIAFGLVWRVASAATITGTPVFQCGFRKSGGTLYANPGHSYFASWNAGTWTYSAPNFTGLNRSGLRYQNASATVWVTQDAGTTVPSNSSGDAYCAAIVILSKSSPTTTSGIVHKLGSTSPGTLLSDLRNALDSGTRGGAQVALSGTTEDASAYTIDEATYGTLDEVFVDWTHGSVAMDILWTGVAKWA